MKKHILLIGGAGFVGVIALVLLMRDKSANGSALPQQAEAPSSFPSYPAPPPLPPFTVNATPYYLTYNVAPDKNAALNSPSDDKKKDGGCGCDDCKDSGTVILSTTFLKNASANVRRAFQAGPNSGSMMAQFPPESYPYLYQKGGTA